MASGKAWRRQCEGREAALANMRDAGRHAGSEEALHLTPASLPRVFWLPQLGENMPTVPTIGAL